MDAQARPVRWGIVGPGGVGADQIAPAILASPGSALVACSGRTPESAQPFARRFPGVRVHRDHEALAADPGIDAVYVATPNALHRDPVIAAARHGKHVLCEKPFALAREDGEAMVAACRDAGVILRVAFQIRLETILQRVRELVASGVLGELRSIAYERAAPLDQPGGWRGDAAQGGIVFDVAVHLLDMVPWLTGLAFTEVYAVTQPDRREGRPDETTAILARLGSACHVSIRVSREIPYAKNDLLIEGTRGSLWTSALRWADEHVLTLRTAAGTTEERYAPVATYRREVEAFEGELLGVRSLLPDGEAALATMRITDAILESVRTRRAIAIG